MKQKIKELIENLPYYVRETTNKQNRFDLSDIDLSGFPGEQTPYGEAISLLMALRCELEPIIQTLEELKKHTHKWDANDYCSICGTDGRI